MAWSAQIRVWALRESHSASIIAFTCVVGASCIGSSTASTIAFAISAVLLTLTLIANAGHHEALPLHPLWFTSWIPVPFNDVLMVLYRRDALTSNELVAGVAVHSSNTLSVMIFVSKALHTSSRGESVWRCFRILALAAGLTGLTGVATVAAAHSLGGSTSTQLEYPMPGGMGPLPASLTCWLLSIATAITCSPDNRSRLLSAWKRFELRDVGEDLLRGVGHQPPHMIDHGHGQGTVPCSPASMTVTHEPEECLTSDDLYATSSIVDSEVTERHCDEGTRMARRYSRGPYDGSSSRALWRTIRTSCGSRSQSAQLKMRLTPRS